MARKSFAGSCRWFGTFALLAMLLNATSGCSIMNRWVSPGDEAEADSMVGLFGRNAEGKGAEATADAFQDSELKGPIAMARLNERHGRNSEAETLYRKVIERDPENPLPYQRLGIMKSKTGQFDEAEQCFRRALELSPNDAGLLTDVGYFYYLQNLPEQSEHYFRQALQIDPNRNSTCNNLAMLLGEQQRDEECLALFRRVSDESEALANMAFIYSQRGELDRAIDTYSRALTLDPELTAAAEALVELAKVAPPQEMPKYKPPQDGHSTTPETRLVRFKEENQTRSGEVDNLAYAPPLGSDGLPDGANSAQPAVWNSPYSHQQSPSFTPAPVVVPTSWQPPATFSTMPNVTAPMPANVSP